MAATLAQPPIVRAAHQARFPPSAVPADQGAVADPVQAQQLRLVAVHGCEFGDFREAAGGQRGGGRVVFGFRFARLGTQRVAAAVAGLHLQQVGQAAGSQFSPSGLQILCGLRLSAPARALGCSPGRGTAVGVAGQEA
ncbi:hypothetical protein CP981_22595 [Streptomyces platensis]|uniref:Uncharacterized protein n=1 Tax=Streptomyces platensis TaxID=58346 RepID=A0AAE6NK35_STRPT|nr:hypothetical protein CP981_22595 [Streptomyces platensis]